MIQRSASTIPVQMLRITDGLIVNQALYAAASLRIADSLRNGPGDVRELAAAVRVNEQALYRAHRFFPVGPLRQPFLSDEERGARLGR